MTLSRLHAELQELIRKQFNIMIKKIFLLIVASFVCLNSIEAVSLPHVTVKDRLTDYKYFYVMPTSGVTSGAGFISGGYGASTTTTIVPSDAIRGYLIKNGYNVLSSIKPELAHKTLIVSYGYAGTSIILQMRNAVTEELVASIESPRTGDNDAAWIDDAIFNALRMYHYHAYPRIIAEIYDTTSRTIYGQIANKTPSPIKNISLLLKYYLDGELMHEQTKIVKKTIYPSEVIDIRIKRDKEARNKRYSIKIQVIE